MSQPASDEVSFPAKPTLDEHQDMRAMKWLLYGPPGIGKSTLIAQAEDILFLTTDDGTKFIRSMHRPILNWSLFKKYVKALVAEQPKQYKGICLDNIDAIFKMCRKYVCEKRGIEHQSDEQWGKAYDITASEFELELVKIISLQQYGLFFVSHSAEKEIKTRMSTITKIMPTVPSQAYKILVPLLDIMAYYGFDGKADSDGERIRRIYFQPTETMDAKDRTTKLPESLIIPDPEEKNGFSLIQKYLDGDAPERSGDKPRPRIVVKRR